MSNGFMEAKVIDENSDLANVKWVEVKGKYRNGRITYFAVEDVEFYLKEEFYYDDTPCCYSIWVEFLQEALSCGSYIEALTLVNEVAWKIHRKLDSVKTYYVDRKI